MPVKGVIWLYECGLSLRGWSLSINLHINKESWAWTPSAHYSNTSEILWPGIKLEFLRISQKRTVVSESKIPDIKIFLKTSLFEPN